MPVGKKDAEKNGVLKVELLTIEQVADWVKVSSRTLHRWISMGKFPAVKFGNRTYRIPTKAVIEYLKNSGFDHLIDP